MAVDPPVSPASSEDDLSTRLAFGEEDKKVVQSTPFEAFFEKRNGWSMHQPPAAMSHITLHSVVSGTLREWNELDQLVERAKEIYARRAERQNWASRIETDKWVLGTLLPLIRDLAGEPLVDPAPEPARVLAVTEALQALLGLVKNMKVPQTAADAGLQILQFAPVIKQAEAALAAAPPAEWMPPDGWEFKPTARGFARYETHDIYGDRVVIQKSSLATEDALWLGEEDNMVHLSQAKAAELIPVLQYFVQRGELPLPPSPAREAE